MHDFDKALWDRAKQTSPLKFIVAHASRFFGDIPPDLTLATTFRACGFSSARSNLTDMTNKISSWSYHDVVDFLGENDFEFMEGSDNSQGAWVKLETNGEPGVIFEFKFKPSQYSAREINRIMRLSQIPQDKWMKWAEARQR
ncbi:MAG TPA: hypothetical protein VKV04_10815 [Verrucomicrobiae bacterium]|nr:hypothetical protein [Verrucomicrobiae bacterium]